MPARGRQSHVQRRKKGTDTSLNGDEAKYATNPAYTTLEPMKDQIVEYWDAKLTELGAEPLKGTK